MDILQIIAKKRDNYALTKEEIEFFIDAVTNSKIPDYQTSSFLMACYINGLSENETSYLTMAMANSGEVLDLSGVKGIKVDKHSTGGVADTTTLILAPLVASLGVPIIKMSGRGLGFTGGTLDKLESIPNFKIEVSDEDVIKFGNTSQIVVMSQSDNLTPADKKLYALRDVTATVGNISLIAASVMSKKIAAGADAIVLDVKCGSGAFMKDVSSAQELAEEMVAIGEKVNRQVVALISSMQQPLGNYIGNSLEVIEAIEVLKGNVTGDLVEVSLSLGSYMLLLAKRVETFDEGVLLLKEQINNGEGLKKFKEFIKQGGGDERVCEDYSLFKTCEKSHDVKASKDGYIYKINCEGIGLSSVALGAGRKKKDDVIDYGAGIIIKKRIGDKVKKGDVIATMFASDDEKFFEAENLFYNSYEINDVEPIKEPLIYKVVSGHFN